MQIRSTQSERNKFEEEAVAILFLKEDRDLFFKALENPPKLNKTMLVAIKKFKKRKYTFY